MKIYLRPLILSTLLIVLLGTACNNTITDEAIEATVTPELISLLEIVESTPTSVSSPTTASTLTVEIAEATATVESTPTIEPTATLENTPTVSVAEAKNKLLQTWLSQLQNGEIEAVNMGESIDWAFGYFLYYGSIEGIGMDNLIYNSLRSYRRLDRGEVTVETQRQGDKNLVQMVHSNHLNYSPDAPLTEQVWQSDAVRAALLAHVVDSQSELTPDEALASDNFVGVIAVPAPASIGEKFLAYGQASPSADFEFVGVVIVVDATSSQNIGNPYSYGEWVNLRWLGDASGPFWEALPSSLPNDPTNVTIPRAGVLLINEAVYKDLVSDAQR